jgi:hypothetical protein
MITSANRGLHIEGVAASVPAFLECCLQLVEFADKLGEGTDG